MRNSCISFGFEKYCRTLTTAEVMLPSIIPIMSNEAVSRTLGEMDTIINITANEPIHAATIMPQLEETPSPLMIAYVSSPPPSENMATPRLAPVLMPRTYGPAKGFRKKVCINNPDMGNAMPVINAVIARGNRSSVIIICQVSGMVLCWKISEKTENGIDTLPKRMSAANVIGSNKIRIIRYIFFEISTSQIYSNFL